MSCLSGTTGHAPAQCRGPRLFTAVLVSSAHVAELEGLKGQMRDFRVYPLYLVALPGLRVQPHSTWVGPHSELRLSLECLVSLQAYHSHSFSH